VPPRRPVSGFGAIGCKSPHATIAQGTANGASEYLCFNTYRLPTRWTSGSECVPTTRAAQCKLRNLPARSLRKGPTLPRTSHGPSSSSRRTRQATSHN
jgi:hypothetical protein